jgi:hypothetical protein
MRRVVPLVCLVVLPVLGLAGCTGPTVGDGTAPSLPRQAAPVAGAPQIELDTPTFLKLFGDRSDAMENGRPKAFPATGPALEQLANYADYLSMTDRANVLELVSTCRLAWLDQTTCMITPV